MKSTLTLGKLALSSVGVFASFMTAAQTAAPAKTFTMDGEFGLIYTTGNTQTSSFSAGITANQELESWSNDYIIERLRRSETVLVDGEEVKRTSAQKFFASAQANYKLDNPDYRLFGFASYEEDLLSNFNYQGTVAAGWNHKLLTTDDHKLSYSVGPGYAFRETQAEEELNEVVVRAAVNYEWRISENARFIQTVSSEYGSQNTKSRAESALSATISGNLSMKFSIKLDHNTNVADGIEKLDTETAVTLVYNFF